MAAIAATLAVAILTIILVKILVKYVKFLNHAKDYVTPSLALPVVGHSYLLFNVNREDIIQTLLTLCKADTSGRKLLTDIGGSPIIWYFHPEPTEEILSSNEHISKSKEYVYLEVSNVTGF